MTTSSTTARILAVALLALGMAALTVACGSESNVNLREAFCADGFDNDFDGREDCSDPDCARAPACAAEHCYNLRDDDKDGLVDCDDPECDGSSVCLEVGEHCVSGEDDDNDGQTDCDDSDCAMTAACIPDGENCTNGIDDDGDGDVDCDDTDCEKTAICLPRAEACANGEDDDGDGAIDCDDTDCMRTRDCLDAGEDCTNGVDDDGDGAIDCGDGDCAQTAACLALSEGCANGVDDDGDGDVDCDDDDCSASPDCRTPPEYCTNGIDDDGDGLVDCNDLDDCGLRAPCLDEPTPEVCDDGVDDNDDGATDCDDPTCADFAGCQEAGLCNNRVDDDNDGDIDCEDSECADEPACAEVVVTVELTGSGRVVSTDGSIDCPMNACSARVGPGTEMEFVAAGDGPDNLSQWLNCSTSTGNVCRVTANADITVTAEFNELMQYDLPGVSGCAGADRDVGLVVVEELRLDALGPEETSSDSAGRSNQGFEVTNSLGFAESVAHFNIFDSLPFAATHACVQLAEISPAMVQQGVYTFYVGTGGPGAPGPTISLAQGVTTPASAGMQIFELNATQGPIANADLWVGVAFPGDTTAAEIATAASVAPNQSNDAWLAVARNNDPTVPHFEQFGWEDYDIIADPRFTDRQPVVRLSRAVPVSQMYELAVEIFGGGGDVVALDGAINCPNGNCAASVPVLKELVLRPTPGPNQTFVNWTGCDEVIGDLCVVRMIENRSVVAVFE